MRSGRVDRGRGGGPRDQREGRDPGAAERAARRGETGTGPLARYLARRGRKSKGKTGRGSLDTSNRLAMRLAERAAVQFLATLLTF